MLRPPSPPFLGLSLELFGRSGFGPFFGTLFGPLLGDFLEPFWGHFGPKRRQKVDLFFARFLLGLGRHFGRLPGRLGALLGRSVFPKCCKKQYETMIFKIVLFRSRSSVG